MFAELINGYVHRRAKWFKTPRQKLASADDSAMKTAGNSHG
jgi:hypothetical protein